MGAINETSRARSAVKEFVRGDRGWRQLDLPDVSITFDTNGCVVEGHAPIVAPTVADIASGFVRLSAQGQVEFREWAAVMLAGSAFIDLSQLERHPQGDDVLSALWDASAGEIPGEKTILEMRALAKG